MSNVTLNVVQSFMERMEKEVRWVNCSPAATLADKAEARRLIDSIKTAAPVAANRAKARLLQLVEEIYSQECANARAKAEQEAQNPIWFWDNADLAYPKVKAASYEAACEILGVDPDLNQVWLTCARP